jgi:hypothetical protein
MKQYRIFNNDRSYSSQANPIIDESVAQELLELGYRVQSRDISDWKDVD